MSTHARIARVSRNLVLLNDGFRSEQICEISDLCDTLSHAGKKHISRAKNRMLSLYSIDFAKNSLKFRIENCHWPKSDRRRQILQQASQNIGVKRPNIINCGQLSSPQSLQTVINAKFVCAVSGTLHAAGKNSESGEALTSDVACTLRLVSFAIEIHCDGKIADRVTRNQMTRDHMADWIKLTSIGAAIVIRTRATG